jgi:pimeloyl-ACP methyl ester carboxylesterase
MKVLRALLILIVLTGAAAGGYHHYKNPETRALDDSARTAAAAPGSYIKLDDGVTHYEAAGPAYGRVAVLVHGFSVPSYIWDPTFAALRDAGYRVIRYDLFGRGLSDRPDAAYDGAFYDKQLDDLLAALKVNGPVDLFGLSFGGYVTAHYASTHPQRIRTLNLVDPSNSSLTLSWQFASRCWALTCSRSAPFRPWPTTRPATSCIPSGSPTGPSAIARKCSTTASAARCTARA